MYLPTLSDAHLVNDQTLSAQIRMHGGKVVFSFMNHPEGRLFYRHLMVQTEGHAFASIPVFND